MPIQQHTHGDECRTPHKHQSHSSREQILVVPPLECAWLPGDGYTIDDSSGSSGTGIYFEARGTNDVTILLTSEFGSRRCPWYGGGGGGSLGVEGRMPCGYTIIIGSHRNSCVKIEKNGKMVCMVQTGGVHPMQLSGCAFKSFWVSYARGEIRVGYGEDACYCVWKDDDPVGGIRYVGLSCWDSHVGYRNVRMVCGDDDHHHHDDDGERKTTNAAAAAAADTSITGGNDEMMLSDVCLKALLRYVSVGTVCDILGTLDSVCCEGDEVLEECVSFAATHIETLLSEEYRDGFRSLPLMMVARIARHQAIPCSEMVVYNAVRIWAGGDDAFLSAGPGTPMKDMRRISYYNSGADSLLPHVRFPLMMLEDLEAIRASSLHVRSVMLQNLVQEAFEFHKNSENLHGKSLLDPSISVNGVVDRVLLDQHGSMRFRQRCPRGCVPLVFMYDGDTNGVCHYIGTQYGNQAWVNPVSAGLIHVSASSPASRCGTDPKALVDASFSRVNFAGPRRTQEGRLESWWMIDLGEHHRLRCTRYSLRHDGSSDFLRDWCLQGSLDGESWETLISHSCDQTLKMSGQYASWPIRDTRQQTYRYFKILQTVPNHGAPNPMHVSLSHVDLYGDFFLH